MNEAPALSQWFERSARHMPWRQTRDPYRIWISEVMLQQTQVATVIPYYEKFLGLFPTVERLAAADEPAVLAAWSGLGYYSRARNLHRGAKFVVEKYRGVFPRDRDALLEVPGIGPYTAGAVASIAFDLPAPLVDGNVQRVLARYFGRRELLESSAAQKFFWETATAWVKSAKSPRVFNQALMELGATICTKGTPRCDVCPLKAACVARREGTQSELPIRKPRREAVPLWWAKIVLEHDGRYFLKKNPAGEWWADLWDFPHVEANGPRALRAVADEHAKALRAEFIEELDHCKHTVTHHKIHVAPFRFLAGKRLPEDGAWFTQAEIERLPLSALARKVLAAARPAGPPVRMKE